MLQAIDYCHQNNIVHRDVKMENFLIDSDENANIIVKLSDFGLACKFDKEKPPTHKCGSILSVAPEMLTNETYCLKVDVWGIGIIMHEILSTELPFYSEDEQTYKKNIVREKIKFDDNSLWSKISDGAKDLVLKLLDKDPLKRPSAREALKHPWFHKDLEV